MELKEYKRSISQPIPGESAVGERLVDDPLFDFVEDQMMKVGSLSHADVQWDEVEHSVVKLLAEKSKDIKLLTYLLQCLHHQASPARFILSFELMASFMSQYWEDSFPAPGKRGTLSGVSSSMCEPNCERRKNVSARTKPRKKPHKPRRELRRQPQHPQA